MASTAALPPIPADFRSKVDRYSRKALERVYGVSWRTVRRWLREIQGIPCRHRIDKRLLPDDFAKLAPTMTKAELGRHYGVHIDIIYRWMRETGAEPKRYSRPKRPVREPVVHSFTVKRGPGRPPSVKRATQRAGQEEDAAQHLRRFYPWVHRSNPRGGADQKGKFWRCGNAVLAPSELLARAEAKGWSPDAWRDLAR